MKPASINNHSACGSLIIRASGIYYAVFSHKGKRVWHSLHTRDNGVATEQYQRLQTEYQRMGPETIGTFMERFLQSASQSLSPKTVSMYHSAFKNLIRICGNRLLPNVVPLDVERFKLIRGKEVSPTSVNIELTQLRAAFSEAVRLKIIRENPFVDSRFLRVPYKEAKCLTEKEFDLLLNIIKDPLLRDIIDFAVHTVMRRGEIVDLKWDDVDCDAKTIRVVHSEGNRVKGGRPRTVPMAPSVYEMVKERAPVSKYVFCDNRGRKLNGGTISKKFKKQIRKAGLDDSLHFHSLRHTGITWLINRGVPPQFVQRIAGHSSLAVTTIYSHVQDKNLIDAISVLKRHRPVSTPVSSN